MKYQYLSCQLGSQESKRSNQRYGSSRGTWGSRSYPTSRNLGRTGEPHQHLCHRHQACSSKLHRHGSPYHVGSSTSRRDRLQRSLPCSDRSKELHPSPNRRGSQTRALQQCDQQISSSMSGTHRCDGNHDDSGGWELHSNTLQYG